jgi:hypothetical protein
MLSFHWTAVPVPAEQSHMDWTSCSLALDRRQQGAWCSNTKQHKRVLALAKLATVPQKQPCTPHRFAAEHATS